MLQSTCGPVDDGESIDERDKPKRTWGFGKVGERTTSEGPKAIK